MDFSKKFDKIVGKGDHVEILSHVVKFEDVPGITIAHYSCDSKSCDFARTLIEIQSLSRIKENQFETMCSLVNQTQSTLEPRSLKGFLFEFPDNHNLFLRNANYSSQVTPGRIGVFNVTKLHEVVDLQSDKYAAKEQLYTDVLLALILAYIVIRLIHHTDSKKVASDKIDLTRTLSTVSYYICFMKTTVL